MTDSPRSTGDRRIALLLTAAAFLLLLPSLLWGVPIGKAIIGGLRILDGDLPYRDFWTMYAPGQFYLTAALFWLFGRHVAVQGAAVLLLTAINAGLFYRLARRIDVPRPAAVAAAALVALMFWKPAPEMSSYEPALLFLLLAMDRVVAYLQGGGSRRLVAAGLLAGVAAAFKHDVAFYILAGSTVALWGSWYIAGARRPPFWVSPLQATARLAAGSLATALPVLAFVAYTAGPDAWDSLIVFPATDFRVVRGEAYPGLLPDRAPLADWIANPVDPKAAYLGLDAVQVWIQGNLPQIIFLAGLIWLARAHRRIEPATLATGALLLAAMPPFWAAAHVQQNTHLHTLAMLGLLLGGIWWRRSHGPSAAARSARRALAIGFTVYAAGLLLPPATSLLQIAYFWPGSGILEFPIIRGIRAPAHEREIYEPIVGFIREHVPPGEPIFSGVVRHDAIVVSNGAFYYLAERPIGTRYGEMHPGFVDRADVQQEIIDEIERGKVRCAVLWKFGWPDEQLDAIIAERRRELPALGATRLDRFLAAEFETIAEHGEYRLAWRRGTPRPSRW